MVEGNFPQVMKQPGDKIFLLIRDGNSCQPRKRSRNDSHAEGMEPEIIHGEAAECILSAADTLQNGVTRGEILNGIYSQ